MKLRSLKRRRGNGQSAIAIRCKAGCNPAAHIVGHLQLPAPSGLWVVESAGRYVAMEVASRLVVSTARLPKVTHVSQCIGSPLGIAAVSVPRNFYVKLLEKHRPATNARGAVRRFSRCDACDGFVFRDAPKGVPGPEEHDVARLRVAKHVTAFLRDQLQMCSCR